MQATDGTVAEQDHVDLIPAGTRLTMTGRRIRATPKSGGPHHPGDILFTSLAKDRGDSAIGVVLSGGGSDGALGIQAIKQGGGTTFAQYPGDLRGFRACRSARLKPGAWVLGCARMKSPAS